MKQFLKKRWDKHYCKDNKKRYWHLTIDSLFAITILTLVVVNTYLSSNNSGAVLGTQNDSNNNTAIDSNQNNNLNTNQNNTNTDNTTTSPEVIDQEPVIIKSTDIKLQSIVRYYTADGEQLGVGPLPPVVNTITKYWVFISVSEFTHNLSDVVISAKLPSNVSLTGKSSVTLGENLSFNENSNEIKWQLGNLTTNDLQQPIGLAFEIQLLPTNSQIGLVANLVNNISISALDLVSNKTITKYSPNLTTDLKDGDTTNSNGVVIAK